MSHQQQLPPVILPLYQPTPPPQWQLVFPEVHDGCEYLYARFSHASFGLFMLLKVHHLCAFCSVALFEILSEAGLSSREDACVVFPVKLYEQFSCGSNMLRFLCFNAYEFRKAHFVKFISASTTFEHFSGDFCFLCCYYVNKVII